MAWDHVPSAIILCEIPEVENVEQQIYFWGPLLGIKHLLFFHIIADDFVFKVNTFYILYIFIYILLYAI